MTTLPSHRTREEPPTTQHGAVVVAWDDRYRHQQFVVLPPVEVAAKPRVFTHWMVERRKQRREDANDWIKKG